MEIRSISTFGSISTLDTVEFDENNRIFIKKAFVIPNPNLDCSYVVFQFLAKYVNLNCINDIKSFLNDIKRSLTYCPQETSIVLRLGVGSGGGGGGVTFLCDTSWENSTFLLKNFLTFWKHLEKGYKVTFALNSLVGSSFFFHKIYIVYTVVCMESDKRFGAQTTLCLLTNLDSS